MANLSVINPSTPFQKLTATPHVKFTIDKPGLTGVANMACWRQQADHADVKPDVKPEGK